MKSDTSKMYEMPIKWALCFPNEFQENKLFALDRNISHATLKRNWTKTPNMREI